MYDIYLLYFVNVNNVTSILPKRVSLSHTLKRHDMQQIRLFSRSLILKLFVLGTHLDYHLIPQSATVF